MLRPAEQHVDAVLCPEEAGPAFPVAPNQGDDDDLGLLALEVVDGGEAQRLYQAPLPKPALRSLLFGGPEMEILPCQSLLVTVAQADIEIAAQGRPQLLQLSGVGGQDRHVR